MAIAVIVHLASNLFSKEKLHLLWKAKKTTFLRLLVSQNMSKWLHYFSWSNRRLNNCLWSDIKKEAFKKTLKLRPKTSRDLLEFYLNRNILTKITGIMSYTQHFHKEKKNFSFQEHRASNYFSNQWLYVLSGDLYCETQGAGLHVRKWKILIKNKTISLTITVTN